MGGIAFKFDRTKNNGNNFDTSKMDLARGAIIGLVGSGWQDGGWISGQGEV